MPQAVYANVESMATFEEIQSFFSNGKRKSINVPSTPKTFKEKVDALFHRTPIPPQATVALTWWEKWKYYGRFPWKPLIHLLIAVLATALVRSPLISSHFHLSFFRFSSSKTKRNRTKLILAWRIDRNRSEYQSKCESDLCTDEFNDVEIICWSRRNENGWNLSEGLHLPITSGESSQSFHSQCEKLFSFYFSPLFFRFFFSFFFVQNV